MDEEGVSGMDVKGVSGMDEEGVRGMMDGKGGDIGKRSRQSVA